MIRAGAGIDLIQRLRECDVFTRLSLRGMADSANVAVAVPWWYSYTDPVSDAPSQRRCKLMMWWPVHVGLT